MIFDKQDNICTITQEKVAFSEFVERLETKYSDLSTYHLIINLFSFGEINPDNLLEFLHLQQKHKEAGKSFVIVSNQIKYDQIPENINLVPTLQEAYDYIEMEEIERDLGL